jgi:drug/metabolite transporter (DMT)-like permease
VSTSRVPGSAPAASAPSRSARARERRLAELGVLATVVIWSANFVVAKAAVEALGPLTFTSIRYVVATSTLFLLVRWRLGPVRPPARTALTLIGLGMLGFGGYQLLWSIGLTQITAGDSALIVAVSPVLTVLLAGAVGMDRLTPPKLVGALVAFGGVAVVVTAGRELSLGASLVGELLTLGAAVLWAVYTIAGTRMLRQVDPLQATAWAVLGGMLFLLPFGAHEIATSPPPEVTPAAVLGILYSGALAAAVSNVLVFNAIRLVGPSRVIVSQFLVPFGAVVLGALVLAEPVGIAQVAGGAVIVFGVWLTRRRSVLPRAVRARVRGA